MPWDEDDWDNCYLSRCVCPLRRPEGPGPPVALWATSPRSGRSLPQIAGHFEPDCPVYVGRLCASGHLLPGYTDFDWCVSSWNGRMVNDIYFEVLVVLRGTMDWVPAADGDVPANAFPAGLTADGERVFSGRARHEGKLIPGRILPREGCCCIVDPPRELTYREYEVLVIS